MRTQRAIQLVLLAAIVAVGWLAYGWWRYDRFESRSVIVRVTPDGDPLNGAPAVTFMDVKGIGLEGSPLKSWSCFKKSAPASFDGVQSVTAPVPPPGPFWFRCFSAAAVAGDLASGKAKAYLLPAFGGPDDTEFALVATLYPDGSGVLWRQTWASARGAP